MSTLIAGLGNVLMGDDAIGPTLIHHLRARYEFPPEVAVEDLGTPGIDLARHMAGRQTVVLLDAIADTASPPGCTRVFTKDQLLSAVIPTRQDAHAPDLREALQLTSLHGPLPQSVVLIGITVGSCEMGDSVNPAILERLEEILNVITNELATLAVPFHPRPNPASPILWWLRAPR